MEEPADADLTLPSCATANQVQIAATDLQTAIDTVNAEDDDAYHFDDCCAGGAGPCNLLFSKINLYGGTTPAYVGCAELAGFVQAVYNVY